ARRAWLRSRLATADLEDVVFASPAMDDLLSTAAEIADFDSTVLLHGETGTGKGMLARFLHRLSRRAGKPFVEVNCGALPESLVESELFGHEAGAFTGSLRTGKKGQFGRDKVISLEAVAALSSYEFPGNVRELRNLVERLVVTTRAEEIGVEHLPASIQALASGPVAAAARDALVEESLAEVVDYRARVEKLERQMLHHFARACRSTYEIARRTGLTQSAVVRKLKKYGISLSNDAADE